MNTKYSWDRPIENTHLSLGRYTIHLAVAEFKSHSLRLPAWGGVCVSVFVFYRESGENWLIS